MTYMSAAVAFSAVIFWGARVIFRNETANEYLAHLHFKTIPFQNQYLQFFCHVEKSTAKYVRFTKKTETPKSIG